MVKLHPDDFISDMWGFIFCAIWIVDGSIKQNNSYWNFNQSINDRVLNVFVFVSDFCHKCCTNKQQFSKNPAGGGGGELQNACTVCGVELRPYPPPTALLSSRMLKGHSTWQVISYLNVKPQFSHNMACLLIERGEHNVWSGEGKGMAALLLQHPLPVKCKLCFGCEHFQEYVICKCKWLRFPVSYNSVH